MGQGTRGDVAPRGARRAPQHQASCAERCPPCAARRAPRRAPGAERRASSVCVGAVRCGGRRVDVLFPACLWQGGTRRDLGRGCSTGRHLVGNLGIRGGFVVLTCCGSWSSPHLWSAADAPRRPPCPPRRGYPCPSGGPLRHLRVPPDPTRSGGVRFDGSQYRARFYI